MKNKLKYSTCFMLALIFVLTTVISACASLGIGGEIGKTSESMPQDVPILAQPRLYGVDTKSDEFVYISDIAWEPTSYDESKNGGLKRDQNSDKKTIQLLTPDGEVRPYTKGIGAQAKSQIDIDVSAYAETYPRFTADIGIDYSQHDKNGNGVIFQVLAGNSISNMTEVLYNSEQDVILQSASSVSIDVDITGYKYIRLYADPNGTDSKANWFDHAIWANARFVSEGYDVTNEGINSIERVETYDEFLSENTPEENYTQHLDMVKKRELADRLGYWNIQDASVINSSVGEAFEWLLTDENALELLLEAGNIGNVSVFIQSLGKLYEKEKAHLSDPENGEVYKKMLLALAVAYSTDKLSSPLSFGHKIAGYDITLRYEKMKNLYDTGAFFYKDQFAQYNMELMRMVMQDSLPNDEIDWLSGYTAQRYPNDKWKRLNPYNYMAYKSPDYNQGWLYEEANRSKYTEKYKLDEYGIPYGLNENGSKTQRTWMVMEAGGICWNISRLGQSLYKTHGIAVIGVYQPSHEAYLFFDPENGDVSRGRWNIGNDISGWAQSFTSWGGTQNYRLLLGWGCQSYNNQQKGGNNASYMLLAQAALNRYAEWQESFYYNLIADSYKQDSEKEAAYELALKGLELNLDSYYSLIKLYERENRPSADWLALGRRIATEYKYFPKPMVDLLKIIEGHLDGADRAVLDVERRNSLIAASKLNDYNVNLQPGVVRTVANSLLGGASKFATFSFDGEQAGKIIFNESYKDSDFTVRYSLDGGSNWEQVSLEHSETVQSIDLGEKTKEITVEHGIQLQILGSSEVYKIEISEGRTANSLTVNDLENRFIGDTTNLEYTLDDGASWQIYDADTRFAGDVRVKVRYKQHGTSIAGPISPEYSFTSVGEKDETNQYIPIKNIVSVQVSSEQSGEEGGKAVDGDLSTRWHTKWGVEDTQRYFIVELNTPRYLTQIDYYPPDNGPNGRLKDVEIYVSMNGTDWQLAGSVTGLQNDSSCKTLSLDTPTLAKFVKIVGKHTYGAEENRTDWFMSSRRFDFYEDATQKYEPKPEVSYSTQNPTNGAVAVTVTLPEGCVFAVGESGTLTITENGRYTVRYIDAMQREQTLTIEVDWIDKTAPTAEIKYTVQSDGSVLAEVVNASEKIVFGEDGGRFVFTKNGTYTFVFEDEAGNRTELTATVDTIKPADPGSGEDEKPGTGSEEKPGGSGDEKPGTGDEQTPDGEGGWGLMETLLVVGGVAVCVGAAVVAVVLVKRRRNR